MDIANLSMQKSQTDTLVKSNMEMLNKVMENNEQAGQGIINMIDACEMEKSVFPHLGNSINMYL